MAVTTINQSANDTFPTKSNGTEQTVGLGNTPVDFDAPTAVTVTVDGSLVGYNNDGSIDLDVWIETAGAVLLASNSGGFLEVQNRTSDGAFTTAALTLNTVNTLITLP